MESKNKKNQYFIRIPKNGVFFGESEFFKCVLKNINATKIKYAGFKGKKSLKNYLKKMIFDHKIDKIEINMEKKIILKELKDVLNRCKRILPSDKIYIFIFPTFNSFIKEKLSGIAGFSPQKNIIILFIYTQKFDKIALKEVLCHEYGHAITHKFNVWKTLLDDLIFEGLAENFRIAVLGGKISPWANSVSKKAGRVFLKKLQKQLFSKNKNLYKDVFFGNKNFPHWMGYSLGYNIVESYISKQSRLDWKKIFRLNPEEILKNSGWENSF